MDATAGRSEIGSIGITIAPVAAYIFQLRQAPGARMQLSYPSRLEHYHLTLALGDRATGTYIDWMLKMPHACYSEGRISRGALRNS